MDFVMDDSLAIYVMTLGVIDEFRSKGVASKLLEKLLTEAK
jgi:ribosomal protein S18 acetylase RimI-like enzyme